MEKCESLHPPSHPAITTLSFLGDCQIEAAEQVTQDDCIKFGMEKVT